jgi:7-keto-8-aminopelargonate synthetase-like enzyme
MGIKMSGSKSMSTDHKDYNHLEKYLKSGLKKDLETMYGRVKKENG